MLKGSGRSSPASNESEALLVNALGRSARIAAAFTAAFAGIVREWVRRLVAHVLRRPRLFSKRALAWRHGNIFLRYWLQAIFQALLVWLPFKIAHHLSEFLALGFGLIGHASPYSAFAPAPCFVCLQRHAFRVGRSQDQARVRIKCPLSTQSRH